MIDIALYQPDIAPNTAAILRLAACFGLTVRVIEPCGFVWGLADFRRAGMDYLDHVHVERVPSWEAFRSAIGGRRIVLMTTKAALAYTAFAFRADDVILMGRETDGVPDYVHVAADARLRIPMRPGLRSLNVGMAAALAVGEALRQTSGFPA